MAKYTVQRRFKVWVDRTIEAESLAEAVAKAQNMRLQDFVKTHASASLVDFEPIDGTGVQEAWDD